MARARVEITAFKLPDTLLVCGERLPLVLFGLVEQTLVVLLQAALAQPIGFLHALRKQPFLLFELELVSSYLPEERPLCITALGSDRWAFLLPSGCRGSLARSGGRNARLPCLRRNGGLSKPQNAGKYHDHPVGTSHVVTPHRKWLVMQTFIEIDEMWHAA